MLKELEGMKKGRLSILAIVKAAKLHNSVMESIQYFTAVRNNGILISLTKPTRLLQEELSERKINTNDLIFMESVVDESNKYKNVVFIPSLEDVTGILIALDYFFKFSSDKKYLILDSMDILSMYNNQDSVINFVIKISQQCSANNVDLVMMMSKKGDEKFLHKITSLFDKTIYEI